MADKVSLALASEIGAPFSQKLHILIEGSAFAGDMTGLAASNRTPAGDGMLESIYSLEFDLMQTPDVLRVVRVLETNVVREIALMKSNYAQPVYSVSTNEELGDIQERLMIILLDLSIDIGRLHFSSFATNPSIGAQ
jgi:hypothetical protein